jgi:hypothetical protein
MKTKFKNPNPKNKIKILSYIIGASLTIISCANEGKNSEIKISGDDEKYNLCEEGLINKYYDFYLQEEIKYKNKAVEAIKTGDEKMYSEASSWLMLSKFPDEVICYANLMAIKNNCGQAYYDIYFFYTTYYQKTINQDSNMINYSNYCLAKSHELGYDYINEDKLKELKPSSFYLEKMGSVPTVIK